MQKTALKKTKYWRNESILKIGHHAKAIAHAKSSLWLKNWNSKKHVKIHSTNHLGFFCAKNNSKKDEIFEKWEHFENRPSCKGYSPCQEIIKVREWIPHIGPLTRVIHLNLFLDMVPSSSTNFTRALRGQPRRLYTQGHAKLPET